MTTSFSVELREQTGKGANHRLKKPKTGLPKNPGVIYGLKDQTNIAMESDRAWRFIKKNLLQSNQMFDLEVKNGEKAEVKKVILQAYQLNPVKGFLEHVDFREVDAHSIVTVDVPVHTTGVAKAVKLGGVLQIIRHTVKVKTPADRIPSALLVDVSGLSFGDSLHVLDLPFPEKVTPILHGGKNYTVIAATAAIKEEVEQPKAVEATEAAPAAKAEEKPAAKAPAAKK